MRPENGHIQTTEAEAVINALRPNPKLKLLARDSHVDEAVVSEIQHQKLQLR
jgi:hypothetical protein